MPRPRRTNLTATLVVLASCAKPSTPSSLVSPDSATAVAIRVPSSGVAVDRNRWAVVGQSHGAAAYVERTLYEKLGEPHFFVHVRVVNLTDAPIGIDLGRYSEVFYANQWGPSTAPHRGAVDEIRGPMPPLDDVARAKLTRSFQLDGLAVAPAHGSVDYYRDFNASTRADVEAQTRGFRYVLLVMDGGLDVTDGTGVDRILPPADDAAREVAIDMPVPWKEIPPRARVLADR